mmetsp:Transcript_17326/g.20100  ORF Transcript_17326/g.20100 Transcript_17326/m.20100 type:complete len:108 (+) Transcript_17326:236-559(+)
MVPSIDAQADDKRRYQHDRCCYNVSTVVRSRFRRSTAGGSEQLLALVTHLHKVRAAGFSATYFTAAIPAVIATADHFACRLAKNLFILADKPNCQKDIERKQHLGKR